MAKSSAIKASILAVGTELTTGQIINSNAAWLSEKLTDLGIEISAHLTVADHREKIKEALSFCAHSSQLIFVCGGLGPTTDDFTREVIADWAEKPLEFHEPEWKRIEARLSQLKISVAPSNRQQSFFPQGARILPNSQGTAAGFQIEFSKGSVSGQMWIFPGPPNELACVWKEGKVSEEIIQKFPNVETLHLIKWECFGKSEAELGELTEQALEGSELQTGYRFHRPYVEVKVWCPESKLDEKRDWIQKLNKALKPWTYVAPGEKDLAVQLLEKIPPRVPVEFQECLGAGSLTTRFKLDTPNQSPRFVSEWRNEAQPDAWIKKALDTSIPNGYCFCIAGFTEEGQGCIGLKTPKATQIEIFDIPFRYKAFLQSSRSFVRAYAIELALKKWIYWLD